MGFSFSDWLDSLCWDMLHHVSLDTQWLLRQTIYTAASRRQVIATLPFRQGQTVADLGTGYGIMAIELAQAFGLEAIGVDIDSQVLSHAQSLARMIYGDQSPVRFVNADASNLPFASHSLDGITVRFLFQHLKNPETVAHEISRILKANGVIFVEDIDDGLTLEYPPPPDSWQHVVAAFARLQSLRGGDRQIGRKLPSYLHNAGFIIDSVQIQPMAQFMPRNFSGAAAQFERERVAQVLPELYTQQLLTPDEWLTAEKELISTEGHCVMQTASTFRVLAHRPI